MFLKVPLGSINSFVKQYFYTFSFACCGNSNLLCKEYTLKTHTFINMRKEPSFILQSLALSLTRKVLCRSFI